MNTTTIQKEQNATVLSQVASKCIRTRIKRELEKMYPLYNEIETTITLEGKLEITVRNADERGFLQKYGFVIGENYPFNAPKIFYQNRKYWEFLRSKHTNLQTLKKVTSKDCLCCSSFHCNDNWGPGNTLIHIIDEIRRIKQQKRAVINKLLADKIKARHLIDDVDLDSWLF
jgi:hypothetical protein